MVRAVVGVVVEVVSPYIETVAPYIETVGDGVVMVCADHPPDMVERFR